MTTWLILGAVFSLLTAYVPAFLLMARVGPATYFGSRDDEGTPGPIHGRAKRAHANLQENFPVFALFGVLSMIVAGADTGMALLGAQLFVVARVLYLPLYLFAVPLVRSMVFAVGWVGLILMGVALI